MPTYQYFNDHTGELFEIILSMSEPKPDYVSKNDDGTVTPKFGNIPNDDNIYHRIYGFNINIDTKSSKTIGSIAEKNTERLIKEGKIKGKKKENPWWRPDKNKVDMSLAGLKGKKALDYMKSGKKPS